jgi:hypothetical protein
MLDQAKRSAILTLKEEGHATRAIARLLKVSRVKVRQILEAGNAEVPEFGRVSKVEAHREDILAQLKGCKGNHKNAEALKHDRVVKLLVKGSPPTAIDWPRARQEVGVKSPP